MTASLRIENLSRHFGGVMVTNDVSLELFSGDRVALIGPNGAGKTTLVNLISGHLQPNGGSIVLDGRDITRMSAARRARLGLARTFQITRLFRSLTVGQNVALPILQRRGLSRRLLSRRTNERAVRWDCEALLDELNLHGSHLGDGYLHLDLRLGAAVRAGHLHRGQHVSDRRDEGS